MVIGEIPEEGSTERGFTEDDHVIKALPANGTNDALDIGPLPRRPRRRKHFLDAHGFDLSGEIASENAITVAKQVTWNLIKWEGLPQLLAGPLGGGMSGDIEVDDPPAVVREHHEHIENLEAECGNREKIDRHQGPDVIVEEGTPSLRGGLRTRTMYLATLV